MDGFLGGGGGVTGLCLGDLWLNVVGEGLVRC